MSNRILKYLLALTCAAVSLGCETMVGDLDLSKLPKTESKLVVECYLSPQSEEIIVKVTESQKLFGPASYEPTYIKNASVTLSGAAGQIQIPYNDSSFSYRIPAGSFKIEAGKKYDLVVSDSSRTVKATCTVPENQVTFKSYTADTVYDYPWKGDTSVTFKASWNDIKGEKNVYSLRGYFEILETNGYSYNSSTGQVVLNRRLNKRVYNNENYLLTDTNLDGITFDSPVYDVSLRSFMLGNFEKNGQWQYIWSNPKLNKIQFEVLNLDENYHKFSKSMKDGGNNDNPFVEPALVYTNIEGGLGCFGAYNTTIVTIKP
jgi:hypothetical protein